MKTVRIKDCPVCGEVIWKFRCPEFLTKTTYGIALSFKKKPFEQNYKGRHFWLLLTDGSRMMVAICKKCYERLDEDMVKKIFADITYTKLMTVFKDKRLTESQKYKLFDRIRTTEVFKWAGEEQEIKEYLRGQELCPA